MNCPSNKEIEVSSPASSVARKKLMLVLLGLSGCSATTPTVSSESPVHKYQSSEAPTYAQPSNAKPTIEVALAQQPKPPTLAFASVPEAEELEVPVEPVLLNCPEDMVDIKGEYCIDRYEASLIDNKKSRSYSPYYAPQWWRAKKQNNRWFYKAGKTTNALDMRLKVPNLPSWQITERVEPVAVSKEGELPNGYLSQDMAVMACDNAGKRLCESEEWFTACRGEDDTDHPYGKNYIAGECNIERGRHPSKSITGNAGINHDDPRLHLVDDYHGEPLLRSTGEMKACVSKWGEDGVYDMVGNIDEWIAGNRFRGGFYSRYGKRGCSISHGKHAPGYYDYSLGVRCCKDTD